MYYFPSAILIVDNNDVDKSEATPRVLCRNFDLLTPNSKWLRRSQYECRRGALRLRPVLHADGDGINGPSLLSSPQESSSPRKQVFRFANFDNQARV